MIAFMVVDVSNVVNFFFKVSLHSTISYRMTACKATSVNVTLIGHTVK